ncbi:hypothetical protein [Ligaoa zhengdingensis]|jgi:hypothetical protein|uniref:hypothetical protein n=1 Tax=Ligaoa zhengdingensis TaxID=2763658 RepID=UPI002067E175|nr:MAG TPA: hypothetical protein [Caudoviricetes sp.]
MQEVNELISWVELIAKVKRMNATDYETYKRKIAEMRLTDGQYDVAIKRLCEVMGL